MKELLFDPLKIYYCVVLGWNAPHEVTAFQGFSYWWRPLHWALRTLVRLPTDVLERTHGIGDMVAHRMGGTRSLSWFPFNVNYLSQLRVEDHGVFFVCFSSADPYAHEVASWAAAQPYPVLHVSPGEVPGACHPENFDDTRLREYCRKAFESRPLVFSDEQRQVAADALARWGPPVEAPSGLTERPHNVTLPNYLGLARCHLSLEKGEGFIGRTEAEYSNIIIETASAVLSVRQQIGLQPLHRLSLLRPPLVLAEPALFRFRYAPPKPIRGPERKAVLRAIRSLQTQKGLHSEITVEELEQLKASHEAQSIIRARQSELETFTLGVGLHAAQTCSGVVRLSPGVNHVFPVLSAYARSVRSGKFEARLKARRLFSVVQEALSDAVGPERLAFIDRIGGPLKIVSDAPIEWIPIRGLPLSLRYDCSRINATPGNLMMGCLAHPATITLRPVDVCKLLVLTAFADNDPLNNVLTTALTSTRLEWKDKVDLVFKTVRNTQEFIETLNAFDGYIMIFDGHGVDNSSEPVGKLVIGKDRVDVWELHGKVRIPPIAILSACDTHGIDASSQATVGNGFLAIGARTVLATLLPVGGLASAVFIGRLVYRIADFLPAYSDSIGKRKIAC